MSTIFREDRELADPQGFRSIVQKGLAAVDAENLDEARTALVSISKLAGENHPAVLHLKGLIDWCRGDIEHASGYLLQAADTGPDDAAVYLDCAELLLDTHEDLSEAEAVARKLLERDELDPLAAAQGRVVLAQIRFEHDDSDPEEALELLDEVEGEVTKEAHFLSLRAAVLVELGRVDDAITSLEAAAQASDESDLIYQLGATKRLAGDDKGATEAMLRVLAQDLAESESDPLEEDEASELREHFEEVMEQIPEPLLRLLAEVPIHVQARPTLVQVEQGIDPRGVVAFEGTPGQSDESKGEKAHLKGIVLMRDVLLDSIDLEVDDEEVTAEDINDAFVLGVAEELRRFFAVEGLAVGL